MAEAAPGHRRGTRRARSCGAWSRPRAHEGGRGAVPDPDPHARARGRARARSVRSTASALGAHGQRASALRARAEPGRPRERHRASSSGARPRAASSARTCRPPQVAQAYEVGGAAALSVLTEEQFFGGSVEDLQEARQATLLPTLRKDFIVDPYQVWESLYIGADAVLLIVAALDDAALRHAGRGGEGREAGGALRGARPGRPASALCLSRPRHRGGQQPRPAHAERGPADLARPHRAHPGRRDRGGGERPARPRRDPPPARRRLRRLPHRRAPHAGPRSRGCPRSSSSAAAPSRARPRRREARAGWP